MLQLQNMSRAEARFKKTDTPGQLSEQLQYLALYFYGLMRTPIMSPLMQTPIRSPYFDQLAEMRFHVNVMSPEEVVPIFYPQFYKISDPNLSDEEFPQVSIVDFFVLTILV